MTKPAKTPHFNNPATNVSNLQGFAEITSAQDDERQFHFGLSISF